MKINDIINEGIWDNISKGIKGAVAGAQQSRANRNSIAAGGQNLQFDIANWNRFIQQQSTVYPQEAKDPRYVKSWLVAWADKNYPRADGQLLQRAQTLDVTNKQAVQGYIANLFNNEMAKFSLGGSPPPPPPAQQATDTQTTQANVLDNFRLAQTDPLIYQYGKKQYHLNDRGNWSAFPGQKEVDQTTAALLSQAANRDGL